MLRRMAGCAIKGENYFKAEITAGVVAFEQPAPKGFINQQGRKLNEGKMGVHQ